MSDTIIRVENLSKQYRLGDVGRKTLSEDFNRWIHRLLGKEDPYLTIGEENDRSVKGSSEYVWALRNINFEVKQGDVIGIIGRNGAGKSTLLKILSKVTAPTTGSIKVKGRIASLLEVGTGFHPELTGRDNVYLNGAILGMTRKEITAKFDEIVDFSGVERYIDTPVKRYSSGMYVRLAFAVAANLDPDILIVDEVLAVGDAEFQKKCLGKMRDVSDKNGKTILFVSHNIRAVKSLCDKGILLENGTVTFNGSAGECLTKYQMKLDELFKDLFHKNYTLLNDTGLVSFSCRSKSYNNDVFKFGESINIKMVWRFQNPLKSRVVSIRVFNQFEEFICGYNTLYEHYLTSLEEAGTYEISFCAQNCLTPGRYYVTIGSFIRPHTEEFIYKNLSSFEVSMEPERNDFVPNIFGDPRFYSPCDWDIKKNS